MRILLLALLACVLATAPARAQEPGLDWLVGTWDTRETFHEKGTTAQGVATFSKVLGGKFLFEEYSSTWPEGPYSGQGYSQWNPEGGQLDMWWLDSEGSVQHSQTTWDGRSPRVFIAVQDMAVVRETYTRTGPDEFHYKMEKDSGQGYQPVMEAVATRRR